MSIAKRHRAAVDKTCAHIPGRTLPEAMIRIACGGVAGVRQTAGDQRRLHYKVTWGLATGGAETIIKRSLVIILLVVFAGLVILLTALLLLHLAVSRYAAG